MSSFIMLCAPSGAGKTTYADSLKETNRLSKVICPDEYRADLNENGDANDQSQNGHIFTTLIPRAIRRCYDIYLDIIYDATNTTRKARKDIIKQAKALGYDVEIHVFRVPIEVCQARNAARMRKVPIEVIQRQFAQFQEPTLDEGVSKIIEVPYEP